MMTNLDKNIEAWDRYLNIRDPANNKRNRLYYEARELYDQEVEVSRQKLLASYKQAADTCNSITVPAYEIYCLEELLDD